MRAYEFITESKVGKAAMSYKRANRYPDGKDIPETLPDRYQPASNPGVPADQKCSNCMFYDTDTKKCSKFKNDPVVRPTYWCAKWELYKEEVTEAVKQRLDPKCWKGYKKQGTKIKGDTRVNNCVKEDVAPKKVGREFNHLEDLVFTEPKGVFRAIQILKDIHQDASDVAIKWDGNPTVYWGREPDGSFRLVGKNNWGREEGKSSSPEELAQFINSRGKGEDWREKFANDMAALWPIFERATPADFVGYVYGDILFHPGKPYQGADGRIEFTPNQTTYSVRGDSSVGRAIAKAKVAVAVHKKLDYFGDKEGADFTDIKTFALNPELVVFAQTYTSHQPAVNADNLDAIAKEANNVGGDIDKVLAPVQGLSDLRNLIYTFVNQQSRAKALDAIDADVFFTWLKTKATPSKWQRAADLSNSVPGALDSMFFLVREIMKAKNEVIAELDQAEGDITAHTAGTPGGEGYVKTKDSVKLVPRDRWTPFRAD